MSTTETGRRAEQIVADFLAAKGCTVVAQNWRTRWCEIDVVATRDTIVYLCEVKYRSHNRQGSGIDYITPKKLQQMRFAAEFWLAGHQWQGDAELCAFEVSGAAFRITNVVKGL